MFAMKTSSAIDEDIFTLSDWDKFYLGSLHRPKILLVDAISNIGKSSNPSPKKIALDKTLTSLRQSVFEIFKSLDIKWNVDVKGI